MPAAPSFWWQEKPTLPAWLLWPLGFVYGQVTLRRMRRPGSDAGLPVLCVGNFIAGGAGKTPTVIALARMLERRGEKPFVLMRGYGGRLTGPVEVDPDRHDAAAVGDEPILMARHVRTVIARDRVAGAKLARGLGASVIVMDDGLQNPALAKRLKLAVVDGLGGVGNGLCLPAGPLRAPLPGQLAETDAVIVIGKGKAGAEVAAAAGASGKPVLMARLEPERTAAQRLRGRKVLALSGIGRPKKFAATLREVGATVVSQRAFGDHHAYSTADIAAVLAEATQQQALIATTEKDWTKLAALWPAAEASRLVVLPVSLIFEAPERVEVLLAAFSSPAGAAQPQQHGLR